MERDQSNQYVAQLLHEVVPDDKSLTIKMEFDNNPDDRITSESTSFSQIKIMEYYTKSEPVSPNSSNFIKQEYANKHSDGNMSSDVEDMNDFEEAQYVTREHKVLNLDDISDEEIVAYNETCAEEFYAKVKEYDIKDEHDDPECLYEFIFIPLPTPPIPPELKKLKFSENVGPIKMFTPYEAFTAIWNRSVMDDIVRETNNNGKYKKSIWTDTNIDELYVYFAITLATSDVMNLMTYWDSDSNFSQAMTYKRFMELNEVLSFTNPKMGMYNQPHAKLFRMKPIIDHLNKSFSSLFQIGQDIVFDEPPTVCKSDGKFVTLKNKCGMKEINISDANTGYVWKLDVLAQASNSKTTRGIPPCFILKNYKGAKE